MCYSAQEVSPRRLKHRCYKHYEGIKFSLLQQILIPLFLFLKISNKLFAIASFSEYCNLYIH